MGRKLGMTQIFKEDGTVVPVSLVEIKPNYIVQVKTKDKDGYQAVQIGTEEKKRPNKVTKGHFKEEVPALKNLKEFRLAGDEELKVGDKFDTSAFTEGDLVKVTGLSKGKGFQGVVKRHGFHGMPASHGAHSVLRHAGSIGQRFPQHTLKGTRMAGRMGADQITTRGLKIIRIDLENSLLAIKGAIPVNKGGLVIVQAQN